MFQFISMHTSMTMEHLALAIEKKSEDGRWVYVQESPYRTFACLDTGHVVDEVCWHVRPVRIFITVRCMHYPQLHHVFI